MAGSAPRRRGLLAVRLTVPAVAVVCGVLAATRLPPSEALVTTYGAASPVALVVGLFAGLSLLVAGSFDVWFGPSVQTGILLVGAGVLWFASDVAGWEEGPALVRSLAAVLAPMLPLLLLGLLAILSGHRRRHWLVVSSFAVIVGGLTAGLATVQDPILDLHCWPTCSDNALLVSSQPAAADLLGAALAATTVVVGLTVLVGASWQLASASAVARRWKGAVLGATALVGLTEAGYGLARLVRPESAEDALFVGLYLSRAAAWSILGLMSWSAAQRHLTRGRALSRLGAGLESAAHPGSFAATLRPVTGDPELDVLYPVGRDGRYVRADGRSAPLETGSGRAATPLRRRDQTVAVLVHDPGVLPMDVLDRVLGPAARLALENERLAAERLARMHDVQDSRHRIVATGDRARRQLERDLHDGAQQSLLALSYLQRVARATAQRSGQSVAVGELDQGLVQTQAALDDLRDLAHGIHPAVLFEAGLAVALRSLAERSSVPIELEDVTSERFDPSVELAAYTVVRDAAERADPLATTALTVRLSRGSGVLVLAVDGHRDAVPAEIVDRVGALGGHVASTARGVRVELPCGS